MVTLVKHDLEFILDQIIISEQHAAGSQGATLEESRQILLDLLPNSTIFFGLRTVDGSLNNLVPGQEQFGALDTEFPRMTTTDLRTAEAGTTYDSTNGMVIDSQPRIISNLIVDQTDNNPAATAAAAGADGTTVFSPGLDGVFGTADDVEVNFIPNTAPDEGLTAPFNAWFTFFGQFFDHGLDFVAKGGSGFVMMPLQPDDPLFDAGADGIAGTADDGPNFLMLTRATNNPGPDGILGTADDIHEHVNTDTPFIDQNQTFGNNASHQVFLREYVLDGGVPVATGRLIDGANGGMANWGELKAQALNILGIELDDVDALSVPQMVVDQYGNFIPGPNGFPQLVTADPDGILGSGDETVIEGSLVTPADASLAIRTSGNFLADIAHNAAPVSGGTPSGPGPVITLLTPDADTVISSGPIAAGEYDNELLDAHLVTGDGRVNENIALSAVHHVFHSEHNRVLEHTKAVLLGLDPSQAGDVLASQNADITVTSLELLNSFLRTPVAAIPTTQPAIDALVWNGERLFQVAKFATEMQYQHLVFEEFARKMQPLINPFGAYDVTIDASITAEFAHAVYRFGHSMLTENVDRLDPNFVSSDLGLIEAFLNPVAFTTSGPDAESAAGAIVRGVTRTTGNELDEFVTEALRNNLLGLPLDLAAINLARGRDVGLPRLNDVRRDFFEQTGEIRLKPYDSWVDFVQNVKHEESVINFMAAYGTHDTIVNATTLADKRAAATNIVLGGVGAPADSVAFLNSTGIWAQNPDGTTTTGVDDIDLWIGGLAEAIEPFGGMLGSTFQFVFETQLQNLQDGDRFYYLARTVGLNFLTQLEQNSFAEMIIRNTDANHLPGDIFSSPTYYLEVDQSRQFNEALAAGPDGIFGDLLSTPLVDESLDDLPGNIDPLGDSMFFDLVIRTDPAGVAANYLHYTGGDHTVLGGTELDDTIIGGIGDDTLWGDAGNDYLNAKVGADIIFGGDGDDILITEGGPGPSNLQGQNGNDVISAGPGEALILGGSGKDYILSGADIKETFGGTGDDFIDAGDDENIVFGGEGGDWLEGGNGNDLLQGDNGNPFQSSTIQGHDVIIGGGGDDDYDSESGDDIMVGSPGIERFEGMLGFDWATHKDDALGVHVDMSLRAVFEDPLPPSNTTIFDRYDLTEGLSGSRFSDILQGDDANALTMGLGENGGDHILRNFDLIDGLRGTGPDAIFAPSVTAWGEGNIMLGGDGSDMIEGRGGNDIIDGDLWLNVRISIRDVAGLVELASVDSMKGVIQGSSVAAWNGRPLNELMLNGSINPGQLHIVREILNDNNGDDFDTAVFSGAQAAYTIEGGGADVDGDGFITVRHNLLDELGLIVGPGEGADGTDKVRNIERLQFANSSITLSGTNSGPVGLLGISGIVAVGATLTASNTLVIDPDNNGGAGGPITGPTSYIWQAEQTPGAGDFIDILVEQGVLGEVVPAAGSTLTLTPELQGLAIRVRGIYQDENGVLETVISGPTALVGARQILGTPGDDILTGTPQDDLIEGLGGNDTLNGLAGNDILNGGTGNDILNGGDGNDTLNGGDGIDILKGGLHHDSLNGQDGNDVLRGNKGNDTLKGGLGDDMLFGGDGRDVLRGNNGNDTLDGGTGIDTLHGGAGNDTLLGGRANDTLFGNSGNDTLNGGQGADILVGGTGIDILTGGTQNDTFQFVSTADTGNSVGNRDLITDFATGDIIDLLAIDANTTLLGNQAFSLVPTPAANAGEISFHVEAGNTVVEGHVDADGIVDFQIEVAGLHALTATDFLGVA